MARLKMGNHRTPLEADGFALFAVLGIAFLTVGYSATPGARQVCG